jgi:hypothetical protein
VAILGLSACGDSAPGPVDPVEPFGSITVQVIAPGVTAYGDITARVVWGEQNLTAAVDANGLAQVMIPEAVSGFGTLTLEPGPNEPMHPGWALMTPGDVSGGTAKIVLAPKNWTIESGDYAGTTVPIDPELAADSRVMPSFWGFYFPYSQDGFVQVVEDNSQWVGEIRSWPEGDFPIQVALDRPGSTGDISAADSVAFWTNIDAMESALGFDAFVPERIENIQILGGTRRPNHGILVQVDSTIPVQASTRLNQPDPKIYSLSADARSWGGTFVEDLFLISADISYAVMDFDSIGFASDGQLVMHEFMHVLGAGHGCSWGSVQTYCASLVSTTPSAADVAHLAVLSELRQLERANGSRWGVLASIFGHRVVTLGLTPIPELNVLYGPISAPRDFFVAPSSSFLPARAQSPQRTSVPARVRPRRPR